MKKLKNKQAKKASKLAKAENMKQHIITVKNAEGDPDTKAEILIQNKINYTPKVSVIIPVYNVEEYLRECLDSVVNQTLKEIEIICVDDGSTDNSLEILKEYAKKDNRITVITQQNLHAGVARNAGLAVAKGEYVHFLDSDDWIEIDLYNYSYEKLIKSKADIFMFSYNKYDNITKTKLSKYPYKNMKSPLFWFEQKIEETLRLDVVPWNKIYQSSFLKYHRLKFDSLRCVNDRSFYFMMLFSNPYILVDTSLTCFLNYRINQSNSLIGKRISNFENSFQSVDRVLIQCPEKYNDLKYTIFSLFLFDMKNFYDKVSDNEKKQLLEKIKNNFALRKELYGTLCLSKLKAYPVYLQFVEGTSQNKLVVKNGLFYPNTSADILIQNKISYTPKVSVIIPVYNVEEYLKECLDSVINQTLKEIEIICVDDGSTDNSLKILKEYAKKDNRISVLTQENLHSGAARNAGLAVAKGEYVHFLDSDDWIDNTLYEKMYRCYQEYNVDLVYCSWQVFLEQKTQARYNEAYSRIKLIGENSSANKNCVNIEVWNKLFRRDIIDKKKIGFPLCTYGEDRCFTMMYMFYVEKIFGIDKKLYSYRIRSNSLMGKKDNNQNSETVVCLGNIYNILHNNSDLYKSNIAYFLKMLNDYLNYVFDQQKNKDDKQFIEFVYTNILSKISAQYIVSYNKLKYILQEQKKISIANRIICNFKFLFNLCNWWRLSTLRKRINILYIEQQLISYRIDTQNIGKGSNAIKITTSAKVSQPAWFANAQGQGQVISANKKHQNITIKAIQDGKLRLDFKGNYKNIDGKNYPVWVDYKSIKIDGKEILSAPIATWHDKPYRFEMTVKDGQIVKVNVVQQYHQYSKDELKDVILKLNPNSDYIKKHINKLTNKIYNKIVKHESILSLLKNKLTLSKYKPISNQELLKSISRLNTRFEQLEQENRLYQAQIIETIKDLKK